MKTAPIVLMEEVEYTESYRRDGHVNTVKAESNDDQEEQGVLYIVPNLHLRLKERTSLVCGHLFSCNKL